MESEEMREQEAPEGAREEAGVKGGAAAMAAEAVYAPERAAVAVWARDLVRWGPIWAGLLLALAIQLVLGTVGLAVALSAYDPAAPDFATRVASTLGIWTAASALIALFVGGYIAGRMAAFLGLRNGLVQGSVVWALALLIGVVLSALGVAGVLGGALNVGPLLARGLEVIGPEAARFVESTTAGAWWFVVGSILAWAAAAGGGVLGVAARVEAAEEGT